MVCHWLIDEVKMGALGLLKREEPERAPKWRRDLGEIFCGMGHQNEEWGWDGSVCVDSCGSETISFFRVQVEES